MHHMRRIGVTADIIATPEGVTIRTSARVASYKGEELGQLILEAPTWQREQSSPSACGERSRARVGSTPNPRNPKGFVSLSRACGYHWYQIAHNAISRGLARPNAAACPHAGRAVPGVLSCCPARRTAGTATPSQPGR